jgi:hypothetical protein
MNCSSAGGHLSATFFTYRLIIAATNVSVEFPGENSGILPESGTNAFRPHRIKVVASLTDHVLLRSLGVAIDFFQGRNTTHHFVDAIDVERFHTKRHGLLTDFH